jgi:hypothetical protein
MVLGEMLVVARRACLGTLFHYFSSAAMGDGKRSELKGLAQILITIVMKNS